MSAERDDDTPPVPGVMIVEPPTVNASPFPASSEDPTATTTLRNRYSAEMYRRFRALKSAIITGVVENDAFALAGTTPEERAGPQPPSVSEDLAVHQTRGSDAGINIEPPRPGQFDFPSDNRKVEGFRQWVDEQTDRGILEASSGAQTRRIAAEDSWQNTYLRQSYSKGVTHADAFLVDQGVIPPEQTLDNAFRAVKHADAAGMIYTRAYNELDGVTDSMSQQMSRVLAEGLSQGHHPREIARQLNDRVENVGLHRGRLIARTETIRAHNEGTLNRYEDMGDRIEGVTLLAEHITAGDRRVCSECQALSGTVYPIREARGRIPVHPNCRCTWVPVDEREISETRRANYDAFRRRDSTPQLIDTANDEPITGGFTLDSDLTEYEGTDRIATIASKNVEEFTDEEIIAFHEKWSAVTERYPELTKVGTWHGEDGFKSIDLNIATENTELAKRIGRENNQQAIWDMEAMEPIVTGGTGDTVVETVDDAVGLIERAIAEGA